MTNRPLIELTVYRLSQKPPLSRSQLAKKIGVSRATVSRWESGQRSVDKPFVPIIAEITGVPPLELMGVAA